jgi:hypothetical protein
MLRIKSEIEKIREKKKRMSTLETGNKGGLLPCWGVEKWESR